VFASKDLNEASINDEKERDGLCYQRENSEAASGPKVTLCFDIQLVDLITKEYGGKLDRKGYRPNDAHRDDLSHLTPVISCDEWAACQLEVDDSSTDVPNNDEEHRAGGEHKLEVE
jgi:hypothetical protein